MITTFSIYFLLIGLLTGLITWSAVTWVKDLGLKMTWWKWLMAGIWYSLLLFFVFVSFTFIGEGETAAGWKTLAFEGVIMIILTVGLVRVLWKGRQKASPEPVEE